MKPFLLTSVLLFLVISSQIFAQEKGFPRDTSYTFLNAYEKYIEDYPGISPPKLTLPGEVNEFRNLIYKNTGSRNLHVDVFTPSEVEDVKLPVVIMVHGGGWISGEKTLLYNLATHMTKHGFISVLVEYRLSPEAKYPAAVYDVKSAIKWIRDNSEKFNINPDKIAVLGTSAGGQIASLVGATADFEKFEDPADTSRTSTEVQAIVDVDGVLAFIHPDSEEGMVASKWLGGDKEKAREQWIEASPLTHIGENTPPMLFVGSSFPRFLAGREEVIEILDSHNIYNETHLFEDAPHSFWLFNPWFEPTVEYVVNFLDDILKE